jgi:site-specific recombinase XerD
MALFQPTYTDKKSGAKKTSPYWWIDFTIGDKRIRESTETTRKTIAGEYEKTRRRELERALAGLPSEAPQKRINTVADRVTKYLDHYPINHRPRSVVFSNQRLAQVQRRLGAVLIPDLTEDRIRDYIKDRLSESAGGRTINMELGELSRALGHKWSALWPRVRKLEENHDVGRALSPQEEGRLLTEAAGDDSPNRNPVLCPFLCIALSTGMRSGEIKSLRWSAIALDNSMMTVGRAKTTAGTGRQIPLNADLVKVLEEHARWYVRKIGAIQPEWYVFPGREGSPVKGQQRPLDPTKPIVDITTAWDALRERSGVQCRFHDLRHTAATKMAEAGVPESTMLAIMGHMSRAMLERYSHIRMAAKREAVKSLELPKVGPRLVSAPMSKGRQSKVTAEPPKAVNC